MQYKVLCMFTGPSNVDIGYNFEIVDRGKGLLIYLRFKTRHVYLIRMQCNAALQYLTVIDMMNTWMKYRCVDFSMINLHTVTVLYFCEIFDI